MDARRPQLPSQPVSAVQTSTGNSLIPPRETASAPLPSPTSQQSQYFAPFPPSQMAPQHAQQLPQQPQQTQQQQQSQVQPSNYNYKSDRSAAGSTAQETSTFIGNYALVAEAAKRAQMAVLMREMEGVELST